MGLQNADCWWQGYGGLGLKSLKYKLGTFNKIWDGPCPDYILIHCGLNDLGKYTVFQCLRELDALMVDLKLYYPKARIVWSQLLPRKHWRFSDNIAAMEKARKRLNRYGAMAAIKSGGFYILHPELCAHPMNDEMYGVDGVHLSDLGNDIFLNQLRAGFDLLGLN